MNKKFLGLAVVLAAVVVPEVIFGATVKTGENYYLDANATINDNLYSAGGTVGISGAVNGDLMVAGGSVIVSGPVSGDVAAAGGNITISSDIAGDLRIAGGSITVSKSTAGDLITAGGQINVLADSSFGKDIKIVGGSINFLGKALKSLDIKGGTVYINGQVSGDLKVMAEDIKLGPNAVIAGNFNYSSPKEAVLEQGATVNGKTDFKKVNLPERGEIVKTGKGVFLGFLGVGWLVKTLMAITAALVLIYFFKPQTKNVLDSSMANFWKGVLRGFAVLFLTPIAIIISFMTVVGVFLGLIAMFFYIAILILSLIFSILIFAKLCLKYLFKKDSYELNWWVAALSAVVFGIVCMVPFVGWILGFVVFLSSVGSVSSFVYVKLRS